MVDKTFLTQIRYLLIDLLNAIDDALGLPRTIPCRDDRRLLQKIRNRDILTK